MHKEHVRMAIGLAVIVVHAMCLGIIYFFKDAYLSQSQKLDVALLFMPITAAYVVAVVRSAVQDQGKFGMGSLVNANYVMIVGTFTVLALGGLLWTAISLTGNSDSDRQQILLFEIAFGAAFGLIASDLFGEIKPIVAEAAGATPASKKATQPPAG